MYRPWHEFLGRLDEDEEIQEPKVVVVTTTHLSETTRLQMREVDGHRPV